MQSNVQNPKSDEQKQAVAQAAIDYIKQDMILGIGTGSTVNRFIDVLAGLKNKIAGTVSSSHQSTERLKSLGIPVFDLTAVDQVHLYVDGADEFNEFCQLIKGGGGALTGEKIVASCAKEFVCIVDESKQVKRLGSFPLPIEVLPMARSYVARQLVKLGGQPEYREGFVTDHGNIILDVHNLKINEPIKLETELNQIVGIVENGLFACRPADAVLMSGKGGITKWTSTGLAS